MFNDFKDIISKFPSLKSFNKYLDKYGYVEVSQNPEPITGGAEVVEENKTPLAPIDNDDKWDSIIPINPGKFDYKKTGGLTNYNITSETPLSYEDVRKLTVNIARSKLKASVEKSEQVLALEQQKRKELMNNIQKYKNIKAIGIMVEDNIQDMDLPQLEHTLSHCEKLFQSQKLKETIKRGTNFAGLMFDTVFPEGIKIGKTKRVKTKGISKAIFESVFDSQSTIGVAFQNIADKHNWNITDEAVLILSVGEMFISNLKVETITPEEEETTKETNQKEEDGEGEEINEEEEAEEEDGYEYYEEA